MSHISTETKQAIIKKALSTKDQTRIEIAVANNIGLSTLNRWLKGSTSVKQGEVNQKTDIESIALVERFKHLQATFGQEDAMVGAYCRKHGIYPHQLKQWETDFMTSTVKQKNHPSVAEVKTLQAEIKDLNRTIVRKDKVLAETVALLVLKKKAAHIWGGDEED